jgi:biotin carboxylase
MKRRKTILILGAGLMQLPAIRIAKSKGWYVLVADGSDQAPGIEKADHFLHIDLKDTEAMIAAAAAFKEQSGLDGVFTAGTDFSLTVAQVAEALSLPGIPVSAARAASDKLLMRKTLANGGINVPAFTSFEAEDLFTNEPIRLPEGLSFPLVVKPADSMGARGVARVETLDELAAALQDAFAFSRAGRVVVETYIDGPEFSIDAIVEGGKITYCGIADRRITFPPYFVEMGHTIPSEAEKLIIQEIKGEFEKGVRAIGIDNGAAKGDLKYSSNCAWIGEIAARLSGGFMSGWTYPLSSGVEVTAAALNIAVGLPANVPDESRSLTSAERGIISIPGKIASLEGIERAKSSSFIKEVFIHRQIGDSLRFPRNNVEKAGSVIALSESRERAEQEAALSSGSILIRLEPGRGETGSFLFGHREEWIPQAFPLTIEENRRYLRSLPEIICWEKGNRELSAPLLPALSMEEGLDWHGLSFQQALDRVVEVTGLHLLPSSRFPSGTVIASLFWDAFVTGGFQGALWIVDTVKMFLEKDLDPYKEFLNWQGG